MAGNLYLSWAPNQHKVLNLSLVHLSVSGASPPERNQEVKARRVVYKDTEKESAWPKALLVYPKSVYGASWQL